MNTDTTKCMPIFTWENLKKNTAEKTRIFRRNEKAIEGWLVPAREIFEQVEKDGNKAIVELALKYDNKLTPLNYNENNLKLSEADIKKAYEKVGKDGLAVIKEYVAGVKKLADALMVKEKDEVLVERSSGFTAKYVMVPRESVGIYCPAGQVPLPIVSGMLAASAKAAGVARIAVFYPPTDLDAEIIVAGCEAGATEFYRIGGAAAMAAMTYGTQTVAPVEMIVGPGSTITQAGKIIAREKGIYTDAIGGPSEQMVIVEEGAPIESIIMATRDILTECEHGETSAGIVITNSQSIAEKMQKMLLDFAQIEERGEVIKESFRRASAIIVASSPEEMIAIAKEYKPEHIGLYMKEPEKYALKVDCSSVSLNPIDKPGFMSTARANYGGTFHCTIPTGPKGNGQVGTTTPRLFLREIEIMKMEPEGAEIGLDICEKLAIVELLPSHRNAMYTTRFLRNKDTLASDTSSLAKVINEILADTK